MFGGGCHVGVPKPIASEPFMILSLVQEWVNILKEASMNGLGRRREREMYVREMEEENITPKGHHQRASNHRPCLDK